MDDNDDHNDHIFDKEPALDYILFQEAIKESRKKEGDNNGCCIVFLLLGSSVVLVGWGVLDKISL